MPTQGLLRRTEREECAVPPQCLQETSPPSNVSAWLLEKPSSQLGVSSGKKARSSATERAGRLAMASRRPAFLADALALTMALALLT